MLSLSEFTLRDWVTFRPLEVAFKQVRNDIWLNHYVTQHPPELQMFLSDHVSLKGQNIAIVVAFEQPWALNWLLQASKQNLIETTVLVFDNSRKMTARTDIQQVCEQNGTAYLALPPNSTKHVNRSHGMAMSWIYENVIKPIDPSLFVFLDHDLIPLEPVDFRERLGQQPFFGRRGGSKRKPQYWSIWAGYSVFAMDFVRNKPLNFLYDFSRGLDTGGRNWDCLFSHFNVADIRFAKNENVDIKLPTFDVVKPVQIIDERWLHIGGISYNDGFKDKFAFFEVMKANLNAGANWKDFLV
jgi:hypothetical protein